MKTEGKGKYGKMFEEDILNSIPEGYFSFKLKDSPSAWGQLNNTEATNTRRFTQSNPCDIIAMGPGVGYLLELKAHARASLSISPKYKQKTKKVKGEKITYEELTHYGVIKKKQIDSMYKYEQETNIKSYFLFNMYEKQQTFLVPVLCVYRAIYEDQLKSLSMQWLIDHGWPVPQEKRKKRSTHWKYDLTRLFPVANI